jgi:hypothetical protein
MRKYGWDLTKAIEKHGFKVIPLQENAKHELGKTYWSGYWLRWYKIIDVEKNDRVTYVTAQWDDGHTTRHCTSLDVYRDYELQLPEVG